ncbi:GNAT family N-acetyltransferase [Bacillus sp. 31A1R]|uniref:GNAT family N-acetyltransferase n=1 Tax=Robertmurraya mangrovi TaxID=3098077 RepID=A0ABU5IWW2_9BACI|nr:GNAT family N-acetyltransferase [Bacillus sp. 31A1R]MDZ5471621.1 GNAT family N-acetyltransferase [Bacillus sp. 31A1R]
MSIQLKKVTKDNWDECIELRVGKKQEHFVASNLYSIAEVQFLNNFEAMAIYNNNEMIGFTMFGLDPDDSNYWIYRMMIDEKHQGKGYGKAALENVIDYLKKKPDCKLVMVGYHQENLSAHKLYESVGFTPKGLAPWGELIASYPFI